MSARTESILAIVAAIFVLLSAMWDARVSVAIAVVALLALGVYKFANKGG
jgi:hypothetical protein